MKPAVILLSAIGLCVATSVTSAEVPTAVTQNNSLPAGNYFNTPGSRTTFNPETGALWLHGGNPISSTGNQTAGHSGSNSCGTLVFHAPQHVVRLDGSINVTATRMAQTAVGNGGKVFVDAAYFSSKGNVYANGAHGATAMPVSDSVIGIESSLLNRQNHSVGKLIEAQGSMFRIINSGP